MIQKNEQQSQELEFPFLKDENHIYRLLEEKGYTGVELGWEHLTFELHANLKDDEKPVDGMCHFGDGKMLLDMGLSDRTARETIIHEIMHCHLESLAFHEANFDGEAFYATNEQFTLSMSRQQLQFNFMNPGLLSLLYDF